MLKRNRYEVAANVLRVVSDTLSVPMDHVVGTTRIREDLNATSMDIVTLVMALDDVFGTEIDLNAVPETNVTIDWIVNFICSSPAS